MSLELYDKAMIDKLSNLFPNVIMAPPDQAFNRSNKSGKVKLPLISVYRISNPIDFEDFNHYETFTGARTTRYKKDIDKELLLNGLPVTITYQIDIWAQLRKYADGLYRELVYYLMRNPNLTIQVPNVGTKFDFAMTLTDIDTSTDYDSFDEKNTIHRYTLTYEIPRARMFFENESNKYVKSIPLSIIDIDEDNNK